MVIRSGSLYLWWLCEERTDNSWLGCTTPRLINIRWRQRQLYSTDSMTWHLLIFIVQCTLYISQSDQSTNFVPSFQHGAGQPMPPRRHRLPCGPISHPQKVPSKNWVLKVALKITHSTTTPAHMTTLYTVGVRVTKRFHSSQRKPIRAGDWEGQNNFLKVFFYFVTFHVILGLYKDS